ncbi:MAG: hypothetical protein HRU32_12505 [Rhodobacteraceae bacterium]|nr:hypothetical protein [Paracoccaceae bacterium]
MRKSTGWMGCVLLAVGCSGSSSVESVEGLETETLAVFSDGSGVARITNRSGDVVATGYVLETSFSEDC